MNPKIRSPKTYQLIFAFFFGLDGFPPLVSTQLTADLTLECSDGSMLHPLSYTTWRNPFHCAKTVPSSALNRRRVVVVSSLRGAVIPQTETTIIRYLSNPNIDYSSWSFFRVVSAVPESCIHSSRPGEKWWKVEARLFTCDTTLNRFWSQIFSITRRLRVRNSAFARFILSVYFICKSHNTRPGHTVCLSPCW